MRRAADLTWSKKRTKRSRPASAAVPAGALVLRESKGTGWGPVVSCGVAVEGGAPNSPAGLTAEAAGPPPAAAEAGVEGVACTCPALAAVAAGPQHAYTGQATMPLLSARVRMQVLWGGLRWARPELLLWVGMGLLLLLRYYKQKERKLEINKPLLETQHQLTTPLHTSRYSARFAQSRGRSICSMRPRLPMS